MNRLWIIVLVAMLTACAGNNGGKFVSTPIPDEIRTISYSIQTSGGVKTWLLNNDDLTVRVTSKSLNGKVLGSNARKLLPNDLNWVIYSFEESNFTKVSSFPSQRASAANELLTIVTNNGSKTYTQSKTTRFPNGFQPIVNVIIGLYR